MNQSPFINLRGRTILRSRITSSVTSSLSTASAFAQILDSTASLSLSSTTTSSASSALAIIDY